MANSIKFTFTADASGFEAATKKMAASMKKAATLSQEEIDKIRKAMGKLPQATQVKGLGIDLLRSMRASGKFSTAELEHMRSMQAGVNNDSGSLVKKGIGSAVQYGITNVLDALPFKLNLATLGIGALATGVVAFGKSVLSASMETETANRRLGIMLGDESKGRAVVEQAREYSRNNTMSFEESTAIATELAKGKVGEADIARLMSQFDNVSVGGGNALELAKAYREARSKATRGEALTGEILDMFARQGVDVASYIRERDGITSDDEFKRKLLNQEYGMEEIDNALADLTGPGGLYEDASGRMAVTLTDQLTILGNRWDDLLRSIGEGLDQYIAPLVGTVSGWVEGIGSWVRGDNHEFARIEAENEEFIKNTEVAAKYQAEVETLRAELSRTSNEAEYQAVLDKIESQQGKLRTLLAAGGVTLFQERNLREAQQMLDELQNYATWEGRDALQERIDASPAGQARIKAEEARKKRNAEYQQRLRQEAEQRYATDLAGQDLAAREAALRERAARSGLRWGEGLSAADFADTVRNARDKVGLDGGDTAELDRLLGYVSELVKAQEALDKTIEQRERERLRLQAEAEGDRDYARQLDLQQEVEDKAANYRAQGQDAATALAWAQEDVLNAEEARQAEATRQAEAARREQQAASAKTFTSGVIAQSGANAGNGATVLSLGYGAQQNVARDQLATQSDIKDLLQIVVDNIRATPPTTIYTLPVTN